MSESDGVEPSVLPQPGPVLAAASAPIGQRLSGSQVVFGANPAPKEEDCAVQRIPHGRVKLFLVGAEKVLDPLQAGKQFVVVSILLRWIQFEVGAAKTKEQKAQPFQEHAQLAEGDVASKRLVAEAGLLDRAVGLRIGVGGRLQRARRGRIDFRAPCEVGSRPHDAALGLGGTGHTLGPTFPFGALIAVRAVKNEACGVGELVGTRYPATLAAVPTFSSRTG